MKSNPLLSPSPAPSTKGSYGSSDDDRMPATDLPASSRDGSDGGDDGATTSARQTFLALVKGYVGPGCLSLPWAVSRVGLPAGVLAIASMCLWTSYNCWNLVAAKRDIVRERRPRAVAAKALTYPDVGGWAYGERFARLIAACICVQQLAICTVFFSFVGENLLAVCALAAPGAVPAILLSHAGVLTAALPLVMCLSLAPNLRVMAPAIALATVLLLTGLCTLGYVALTAVAGEDGPPGMPAPSLKEAPLALCAVLYSYEGVCLILPVEMAMAEPQKFRRVFSAAMVCVAGIFAAVSSLCVYAFGEVTNGSVTAFLLEKYKDDDSLIVFLMAANTLVSLSVLFTYPLQLFPTLELLGPKAASAWGKLRGGGPWRGATDGNHLDLTGFDPLPERPEGNAPPPGPPDTDHEAAPSTEEPGSSSAPLRSGGGEHETAAPPSATAAPPGSVPGDSVCLRMSLVLATYAVAVVVPNVQVLISLAGALAGSSVALLFPPLVEFARLERLAAGPDGPPAPRDASPLRHLWRCDVCGESGLSKLKCLLLFWMGFFFMLIGAGASIADILRLWFKT